MNGQADTNEIEELFEDILGEHEAEAAEAIQVGSFGAYEHQDGYDIVEYTSESFALQNDSDAVEGVDLLCAGSIVCQGIY